MSYVRLKLNCQIGELPTLAGFVFSAFTTDQKDFEKFSPDFNATFSSETNLKINALKSIVNPKQLTAELKLITADIYSTQVALRQPIDYLEAYINRANSLTIAAADFGIKPVRQANNSGNIEGLTSGLDFLISNTKKNIKPLADKGFTSAQLAALEGLNNRLLAQNIAQNQKISERKGLVESNYTQMNELWDIILDICDIGKRIYKTTNPAKLPNYTIGKLITRMRNDAKKTMLTGVVTLNDSPAPKAILTVQPIDGGRTRKIKLNADATFSQGGLFPETYRATCTFAGLPAYTTIFTIESNVNTELNINLTT